MKNTKLVLVGVAILAILFGVILFDNSQKSGNVNPSTKNESGEITNYIEYSEVNFANAQKNGRVVLYFWASWCPTCKVLDQELKEKGNELPNDVTILQVNYDTEKELKKIYGITQQHTLVQVDKDGNEVEKWIGGGFETIKQQLK